MKPHHYDWPHCPKGHVTYCQENLAQLGVPVTPVALQPATLVADRLFTVDLSSFSTGVPQPSALLGCLHGRLPDLKLCRLRICRV